MINGLCRENPPPREANNLPDGSTCEARCHPSHAISASLHEQRTEDAVVIECERGDLFAGRIGGIAQHVHTGFSPNGVRAGSADNHVFFAIGGISRVGVVVAGVQQIVAGAAVDQVLAGPADQRVVATVAEDLVVATLAVDGVVVVASADAVVPFASQDDVVATFTADGVVSVAAIQRIVAGTAEDLVVVVATLDEVIARATGQDVVAIATVDRVVAVAAGQRIGTAEAFDIHCSGKRSAADRVITRSAGEAGQFHTVEDIGASARHRAGRQHELRGVLFEDRVEAAATDERIVASSAGEHIVAVPAFHRIGTGSTFERVGTVAPLQSRLSGKAAGVQSIVTDAADQPSRFNRGQIVGAQAAGELRRGQREVQVARRKHLIGFRTAIEVVRAAVSGERIHARFAVQEIVAGSALEHIVARTAVQRHRTTEAGRVQRVVSKTAGQYSELNVGEVVQIQTAGQRRGTEREVGVSGFHQPIVAGAAVNQVTSRAAGDDVVLRTACQHIVAGSTVDRRETAESCRADHVVASSARQDRQLNVAEEITADAARRREGADREVRVRSLQQRVRPVAAVQVIVARAAGEHVVVVSTEQRVVARTANQRVLAVTARERHRTADRLSVHHILAASSQHCHGGDTTLDRIERHRVIAVSQINRHSGRGRERDQR